MIRFAFGGVVAALLTHVAVTTAGAQTCPPTEYPCPQVFLTDPQTSKDPILVPIVPPPDDPEDSTDRASSEAADGGGGNSESNSESGEE